MRLEGVAFRYHRRDPWVLRDVTLTMLPGGVTEVTGRNGAGKSTLLRVIAGLRSPYKGIVKDRPRRVGYAPERFPVDQPFTVRGYLDHMAAMRGVPAASVGTWAERLGFDHLLNVRLPELSKGSAQKVGLAQAFLDDPGLLILDEPFAGLDAATRAALPRLISEFAANEAIVVVSDHQRCIEALPGIDRLRVADGTVTSFPPEATSLPPKMADPPSKLTSLPPEKPTDLPPKATTPPPEATGIHPKTTDPPPEATNLPPKVTAPPSEVVGLHPEMADPPSEVSAPPSEVAGLPTEKLTGIHPKVTDPPPEATSLPSKLTGLSSEKVTGIHPETTGLFSEVAGLPSGETNWTVLEIEVPEDEADTLETKLRADGYRVRRPKR
ncbi:ATP-binding cassette domain-containing protein [Actinomadura sp. 3N508]|uniref:ATP-binding cassette domain-containing protein n=1 Tax=Actinomadura sp. 3N508 TaxID=3375153 RepID=UPI0037AC2F9B